MIWGDSLAREGEPPSWLASLASDMLGLRPSMLPLPFLWENLTPLRPLPMLKRLEENASKYMTARRAVDQQEEVDNDNKVKVKLGVGVEVEGGGRGGGRSVRIGAERVAKSFRRSLLGVPVVRVSGWHVVDYRKKNGEGNCGCCCYGGESNKLVVIQETQLGVRYGKVRYDCKACGRVESMVKSLANWCQLRQSFGGGPWH